MWTVLKALGLTVLGLLTVFLSPQIAFGAIGWMVWLLIEDVIDAQRANANVKKVSVFHDYEGWHV